MFYKIKKAYYLFLSLLIRPVINLRYTKSEKVFFFVPNYQLKTGGMLSVYNLYERSKNIKASSDVFLLAAPSVSYFFFQKWFKNHYLIYNILSLKGQISKAKKIIIHIPECFVEQDIEICQIIRHSTSAHIHINILNQNNLYVPDLSHIDQLRKLADEVTMTINFKRDLTIENRKYWGLSLHYLPAWFINTSYEIVPYEQKENILIVSDNHSLKEDIINKIQNQFNVSVYRVKNVKYHDFLKIQKKAKWAISFGEGFDNYFVGGTFFGGVAFTVYNRNFFPASFPEGKFSSVFDSYETMFQTIVSVMNSLDNKKSYEDLNASVYPYIYPEFNLENHISALKDFYNKNYTFK